LAGAQVELKDAMPLIRSLPQGATFLDMVNTFAEPMRRLIDFEHALLRGPSPLTVAERELIGAYTSGINDCDYCFRSHQATAANFGIEESVLDAMVDDLDSESIDEKIKPLLRYARKLTATPAKMTEADAAAVYDAGWNDEALFHATAVCAYFNFANRLADGSGLDASDEKLNEIAKHLAGDGSYATVYDSEHAETDEPQ